MESTGDEGVRFATFEEESLYLGSRLGVHSEFANVAWVVKVQTGRLDPDRLSTAVTALVEITPALKSVFFTGDQGATYVGTTGASTQLEVVDIPCEISEDLESAVGMEERVIETLNTLARAPIDPRGPEPLVRFYLVQLTRAREFAHSSGQSSIDGGQWLLVNAHHAIVDGAAMKTLFEDLAKLYGADATQEVIAEINKRAVPSPKMIAMREKNRQGSEPWLQSLKYWKSKLHGSNGQLILPSFGSPIPQSGPGASDSISFTINKETTLRLREVGRTAGGSLFSVLIAGLSVLMSKWSGEFDLNLGTVVAGRRDSQKDEFSIKDSELQRFVGCLVNMITLRFEISPDMSLLDVVKVSKSVLSDAVAHSDVPFTLVRKDLPDGMESPFQVSIVKQDTSLPKSFKVSGIDAVVDPLLCDVAAIQQDLIFEVMVRPEEDVSGRLRFKTERFDTKFCLWMTHQYKNILEIIGQSPTMSLRSTQILNKEGISNIIDLSTGRTSADWMKTELLHQAFAVHATKRPNQPCLEFEGASMTYKAVHEASDAVASALQSLGVQNGQLVGVLLDRSFDLFIAILGVLKSGAGYLPLDPSYPPDRLQGYIEDSQCPVLITKSESVKKAEQLAKTVSCRILDVSAARAMGARGTLEKRNSNWESPAYCIFTSGSTGRPKGVLVPHRALTDFVVFNKEFYKLGYDSKILMTISICFDPHILQSLVPLAAGSTVVIARPGGHLDGRYIANTILKSGITAMTAGVPTLVAEYVEAMEESISESPGAVFHHLQWWGMGGESLNLDLVRKINSVSPSCQVVNDYGPTEVTVSCVKHLCSPQDERIVIGRPDTNVHAYIVDANLQAVPAGAAGELLLSGPRVALGYIGKKELTRDKFVSNPFFSVVESTLPSEMVQFYQTAYRSGDLVRWLPDGTMDFLGRVDRQIKIMGTRIELGEVEKVLTSFPGVKNALAAVALDPTGIKRLIAYITPKDVDLREILTFCRAKMIAAMVPTAIVTLTSMPLMKNGKVDIKNLPDPNWSDDIATSLFKKDAGDIDADDASLALMTQTEQSIANIAQRILERSAPPKVDADLLLLGLNSIKAMKLLYAINASLGINLGFKEIMEKPMIQAIAMKASLAEGSKSDANQSDEIERIYQPSRQVYPASTAQKRLWVNAINNPGSLRSTSVHDISGVDILPDVLLDAANIVSRRHVILRTLYEIAETGELLQVVDLERDIQVRVYQADGPEAAEEICGQYLERPFVLDEDLPFRILLIPYDDAEKRQLLVLDLHHICVDGWSSPFLISDLSKEYAKCCQERNGTFTYDTEENLALQYIDVAAAQDAALSSTERSKQLEFWKDMILEDNEQRRALELGDLKAVKGHVGKEKIMEIPFDLTLSNQLRQAFHSARCSLHSGFMALLQAQLSIENGGAERFVVGTVISGRTLPAAQSTIGFFVNTLAIPANVKKSMPLNDLLEQVKSTMLECYGNSDISFNDVLSECHDSSDGPLIDVMFAMQTDWLQPIQIAGAESSALMPEGQDALFPLTIQIVDCGDDVPFVANIKYDDNLFSQDRAQRLADHLLLMMETFASDPCIPVGEISLLTEAEKELVLHDWIGKPAPWPANCLAHEMFLKHAKETPNKVALHFGEHSMTYAELDRMSNQLANCLQSKNIGPDVMVTVLMGRCIEFIICVLAINKAGGAYIPLDEEYPEERLQYIMKDSATPVLLTLKKLADKALLAPKGCHAVYVDIGSWDAGPGKFPESQPLCQASPESLVYCIYTSGTTGNPKGTMLEHRNLVAYLHSHTARYPVYNSDVFSQLATISFDASIHEYWLSMFAGGSLVIIPGKESMAPFDIFKQFGVSVSIFPTALWDIFAAQTDWNELPNLRLVAVGGDVLRKGKPIGGKFELCNSYGPTEITVMCTSHTTKEDENYPCIGAPLPNSRCYIVDDQLQLLPVGVPGELVVGGPGVARGYHNQPAMTAEKFIPDPFSSEPHAKLYRTGDLARWRSDGTLDFIGRADSQVKIRGYRIEISEVESTLLKVQNVEEGLVVALVDPARNRKVLVAYAACSSKGGSPLPDSDSIKTSMSQQLPDYMVPSHVVVIPGKLPRTVNGKYDRKALPAPTNESRQTKESGKCEENELDPMAQSVEAIIQEVLGISESISLDDDIFELGADSLQAALVVSRIRKALDVSMEMRQIYEDGSIATLVNIVKSQKSGDGDEAGNVSNGMKNGAKVRRFNCFGQLGSSVPVTRSILKRICVPIVQLIASLVIVLFFLGSMAPGYAFLLVVLLILDMPIWLSLIFVLPVFFFLWGLTMLVVSMFVKWVLIGKYKPGVHTIWSWYFTRWWVVQRIVGTLRPILRALPESWLKLYYRCMGARLAQGVSILSKDLSDFDLISIGADTFIGKDVTIAGHIIESGRLLLGPVVIGKRSNIGMFSFISPESTIDDDVHLSAMTLVPIGSALPPGTRWLGSPARRQEPSKFQLLSTISARESKTRSRSDLSMRRSFSNKHGSRKSLGKQKERHGLSSPIIFCLGVWRIISSAILLGFSFYPFAVAIFYSINIGIAIPSIFILGFGFVYTHVVYMYLVALLKFIMIGQTRPGKYHLDSWYAQRFLMVSCWLQMPVASNFCSLFSNTPILTSVFKALGAKLGGDNIILSPSNMSLPGVDHLEISKKTVFGGNAAVVGCMIEKNELIIEKVKIGTGCFLGDNSVILPGATLYPSSLAGTLTLIERGKVLTPGSVWVGSPAICLDKGALSANSTTSVGQGSKRMSFRSSSMQQSFTDGVELYKEKSSNRLEGQHSTFERSASGQESNEKKRNGFNDSKRRFSNASRPGTHTGTTISRKLSLAMSIVNEIEEQQAGSKLLKWGPLFISLAIIPLYLAIVYLFLICILLYLVRNERWIRLAVGFLPIYLISIGVVTVALLLAYKWLAIGRFRPSSYPLQNAAMFFWWTTLISLSDFAMFLFLGFVLGTEWTTWFLRAAGATIGKDTYLDGIPTVEYDLLKIGDRCTIGEGSATIGHTLENNMLNFLNIEIGDDSSIGSMSHVLPNSVIEPRARIGVLSLVMKGEQLGEGWWEGSPVSFGGNGNNSSASTKHIVESLKREMMRDGKISPSQLFLPSGGLPRKTGPPKVALLTGATGFVGAFLLHELMDHMDVVYCLVRASSIDAGMGRIKENLIRYSLVKEEEWHSFASKIIPMLGDLGQRNLGLGAAKFEQIAHHVDIVYHNGAMVNMSFGYGTLKAPNVGGTLECLRLATLAGFAIPIHYISTEGVLPASLAECKESPGIIKKKKKKFVSEEYVLSDPDLLHDNGYDQSKWVAENLALDAASRGYPIATYRLGRIGPDSRTGASNTDDFLLLFVKGCLQMKCFPTASTFEFPINMIPANITASRICSISLSDEPASGVYHIGNPDPLDYEIVPRTLHEMGYEFAEVPYQMWRQRLLDAATEDNVLKPLENAFGEGNASLAGTLVDCTRAGIASSPLKPADIKLCFTYMQTQGFLPLP